MSLISENKAIFTNCLKNYNYIFRDPVTVIEAKCLHDVRPAFDEIDAFLQRGYWAAGIFSYELGYALCPSLNTCLLGNEDFPLMQIGIFKEPPQKSSKLPIAVCGSIAGLNFDYDRSKYTKNFEMIKRYIAQGKIYQLNYTFPLNFYHYGAPETLYAKLLKSQPVQHAALVDFGSGVIVSCSPELFFKVDPSGKITARPMKGTAPRGFSKREDQALKEWLSRSEKNRAENLMIVDLLRNDLGRISTIGSVQVPELFCVETYKTLHQMTSSVVAELRKNIPLYELFQALFPCGSVTGAPKIQAMKIIHELEDGPRGAYCGSIGWIAPSRSMKFNVAIRTLTCLENQEVRLNVGGGIVFDSELNTEFEEALLKAQFVKGLKFS